MLVISVRGRERLRDELLVKNEIQERGVQLVGVRGCVAVWNEGRGTTNAIELQFKESKCVRVKSGVVLPVEDIWGGIYQKYTECLDSPVNLSVCAEGRVPGSDLTSTPGSLWLLSSLVTSTISRSPPTASDLYLVKNA